MEQNKWISIIVYKCPKCGGLEQDDDAICNHLCKKTPLYTTEEDVLKVINQAKQGHKHTIQMTDEKLDFAGYLDKINIENDMMELTISMASDYLAPEQLHKLLFLCGNGVNVEIIER